MRGGRKWRSEGWYSERTKKISVNKYQVEEKKRKENGACKKSMVEEKKKIFFFKQKTAYEIEV